MLAIIHGFGENDWRDPQATQTFLLKNVSGSNMAVLTGKDFQAKHSGRKLPRPAGDLIEETLAWHYWLSLLLKCKLSLVRPKDFQT